MDSSKKSRKYVFPAFGESPCLRALSLVVRPQFHAVGGRNEHHGKVGFLLIYVRQVRVEVLSPKIIFLEFVVEYINPFITQMQGNLFDIRSVLSGKRERYMIFVHWDRLSIQLVTGTSVSWAKLSFSGPDGETPTGA